MEENNHLTAVSPPRGQSAGCFCTAGMVKRQLRSWQGSSTAGARSCFKFFPAAATCPPVQAAAQPGQQGQGWPRERCLLHCSGFHVPLWQQPARNPCKRLVPEQRLETRGTSAPCRSLKLWLTTPGIRAEGGSWLKVRIHRQIRTGFHKKTQHGYDWKEKKPSHTRVKHCKSAALKKAAMHLCEDASLIFPRHRVTLSFAQLLSTPPSCIRLQEWKPPSNTQGYHWKHLSTLFSATFSAHRGEDSDSNLTTREVESITPKQPWKVHYGIVLRLLKKEPSEANLKPAAVTNTLPCVFFKSTWTASLSLTLLKITCIWVTCCLCLF